MKSDNLLFFKEIEDYLSVDNITISRCNFKDAFTLYGLTANSITETDDDIILHFDDSSSSWKQTYVYGLEKLFDDVKVKMEESYLIGGFEKFDNYINSSIKVIRKRDPNQFTKPFIDSLFKYFQDKYNLYFDTRNSSPIQLKHGITNDHLGELYNLSIDDYIDDENFDVEDFIAFFSGSNTKKFKFKCSTKMMVQYIQKLLPLIDGAQTSKIGKLYHFYSSNQNLLTESNYRKTISQNAGNVKLYEDLLSYLINLNDLSK